MHKCLTSSNEKLQRDNIWVFSLVAVLCCPFRGICEKLCYARGGNFGFPSVHNHHMENYKLSQRDDFVEIMCAEIDTVKPDVVRLHDAGDFYSVAYLYKWISIAVMNPDVIFYAYTKSFPLFKGVTLPPNMIVIGSAGGKLPVPADWPKAIVIPHKDKVPVGTKLGNKSDLDNIIHIAQCVADGKPAVLAFRAHGLAKNWLKTAVS